MPIRFAETVLTESVSVSIANALDLSIFFTHFSKLFSDRTVSYFESFFCSLFFFSLFLTDANSNSEKILLSSLSSGFSINRSLNSTWISTSCFKDTRLIFLSKSSKEFLRFSPTTPLIDEAFSLIESKSPNSFNHLAAVFCPTFGTPGILSDESPTSASISLI